MLMETLKPRVQITIGNLIKERADAFAKLHERSLSAVIEEALKAYLDAEEERLLRLEAIKKQLEEASAEVEGRMLWMKEAAPKTKRKK